MAQELASIDLYNTLRRQMDDLLTQFAMGFPTGGSSLLGQIGGQQGRGGLSTLTPPAEVVEDHDDYRIITELPGIDPNNVDVNVSGGTLTIRAERQHDQQRQQGQQGQGQEQQRGRQQHYLVRERSYGVLQRQFRLPDDVDRNRIGAEFRNGLLTLTLPKSQETRDQRRRIEIKSS